jgi:hypothetical protein
MRALVLSGIRALSILPLALPVSAAPVRDQSHEASTASVGTFSGITRAQTIMARLERRLVRVDLALGGAASDPHMERMRRMRLLA